MAVQREIRGKEVFLNPNNADIFHKFEFIELGEMDEGNFHSEILRVAHDIYERSGRIEGHDLDNWLEAERIVKTLRKIVGVDGKKHIFVNFPRPAGEEEGEYSKWMIKFFER